MCIIDIIETLLNHEFKHSKLQDDIQFVSMFSYYLLRRGYCSKIKKFKILEFKTRNKMSRNEDQDKKNSLKQEILSWWKHYKNVNFCMSEKIHWTSLS